MSTLDDFIISCVEAYSDTSSALKTRGNALVESEERATRYRKTRVRQKQLSMQRKGKPLTSLQVDKLETSYRIAHDQYNYKKQQGHLLAERAKKLMGSFHSESIEDFLTRMLPMVDPHTFYESIFRTYLDVPDAFSKGEYTGIVTQIHSTSTGAPLIHRYSITDGLIELDNLIKSSTVQDFSFLAPISYCGKRATAEASRFLFAFAIDLDDLIVSEDGRPQGLYNLYYQMFDGQLPEPTYVVSSGTGVHLYYVFDAPVPLWAKNKQILTGIRKKLVKLLWNSYITNSYTPKKIQYESLYQGFRVVGTYTKTKSICRAYRWGNGDTISLGYLLPYLYTDKEVVKLLDQLKPKTKYNYSQLKELYPGWTKRHFKDDGTPLPKDKQTRLYGGWTASKRVYDWYLDRITKEVESGHRYHSLMCLSSYAEKCGVDFETFKSDCWGLFKLYKDRDSDPTNPWTENDVKSAIKTYGNPKSRYLSIDAVSGYTGLQIKKNKRNGRKQRTHMQIMSSTRDILYPNGTWRNTHGAPTKEVLVKLWKKDHPTGTKSACAKDLGISRTTVTKWWD